MGRLRRKWLALPILNRRGSRNVAKGKRADGGAGLGRERGPMWGTGLSTGRELLRRKYHVSETLRTPE